MPKPARFDALRLDGLPPVVQRYFLAALPEDAPIVAAVTVNHSGKLNMGEAVDKWRPFHLPSTRGHKATGLCVGRAHEHIAGLSVRVHDAYIAGKGVPAPAHPRPCSR